MQIKIYRDVKQYVLTSSISKEDIELVKKYRPDSLKIKDADGNDVFGMSYTEGKPAVSKFGVTFSAVNAEGKLIATGSYPEKTESPAEFVADLVGAALPHINELEALIPDAVAAIKTERAALLESVIEG